MKKLWKRSLSLMLALAIIVGILPMSAIAATAHETLDKADGILWLYDNDGGASDEFLASVMGYELDNMIRKAVGEPEDDESIKVTYPHGNLDADVGTSAVFAVAQALADEVIGVLKSKDLIVFKVGGHEKKIAVRTIDSVGITLKKIVISDRAALADLEGKVEELLQMDAEGYNDYLTIEHNGVAKLNKTRHETVIDIDDSYEWPTAAESKNGGVKVGTVTVTVYADDYVSEEKTPDRKQVASTDVVLQDLREVLTDVYDYSTPSAEGKQVKYHYYADEEVPAAPEVLAESADGYYTSTKWELNADEGVYYLDWTPKVDISAPDVAEPDGIADQTQKFTITYVLDKIFIEGKPADGEIGTDLEMYEGVAYGAMTPAVTGTPEYPGTEYSLGGWVDANGKAASATVKGAAVYFPNFTKNPIATFEFYLDEELVDSTTVAAVLSNGNYVVVPDDYAIDGYILHLAYNATTGNEVNLPLTTFNIEGNTTVQLYFYSDSDKNGKFDGTEDDPLYVYNYYLENSNTPGETKTVLKSENFDVQSVQYPADQLGEDEKFMGWQVSVAKKVENAGIAVTFVTYTHECKPIIITDKNNNGKDDSLEEDFVTLAGGVGDYELVDGNLKITNGEYTGWIKITDLEGKSILLPGENGGVKFSYDPATTVITASPLWNADKTEMSHYVADIKVKGESAGTYEDFNLVCAPIAQANGVMLTADENVQVEVIYATATAFEKADAEANTLKPAQPSYDEAEVYAAAIKTPAFSDAISIQYAARIAGPVTVKLDGLLGQMNGTKLEMLKPALETFLNGKTTYEFNLSTKYLDISASVTNRTPDAIANEYFKEVVDNLVGDGDTPNMAYYNQIGGIDGIIRELESRLDANANLHKFGMVTTENLSITYQTDAEYAHTDLVLVIEDPRPATKIVAKNTRLEKAYSSFDNDDLLANVELQLADGSVVSGELDLGGVNYAKMDVGEYQVKVNFQGNEDYRDSEGAFTLVVTPADASVQVPEKITVMAGGQYNPAPQDVTPENMAVVHMIAGFEMNELAFNEAELLQNGNFVLDEDTIEIKVWLKMPAMLAEVASGMGVDFESNEFVDLKEVQSLIGRDADTTIQTYYKDYVEQLLAQLPGVITDRLNLQGLSEANIAVKIRIDTLGDQTYPVNPGLYLNMAANLPAITKVAEISGAEIPEEYASIVNDKNYTAAYSTGYIVISPMVPVPNSGGVELFYKNTADTQNVFTFANGTEAALKVAVNGVELEGATPTYYGLNTSLDQVTGVPSEPGLYIAFYNHTATVKNEITGADEIRRLGSDFALILINKSSASLEIVDETVTYDGEAHLPAIKVKANGAVVTDAAVTVISGSVNSGSATSITELQANINIDFPAKLDALWNKYWQSKGQAAPNTATPNDVVAFLKYCKTTIIGGAEDALVLMEGLGIPTGYVDGNIQNKLENGIDQATVTLQNLLDRATIHLDNLIAEVEKIGSKFDDEVTLTIKDLDELDYTATGYYLFAGIVTDPQYTPAVGAGLLTITSLHEYEMYETRVPYDGEPHFIDMTNESGRDSIYIIVDDNGDVTKVNFRLDNNLTTVMEALLDKAGYEPVNGSNVVVGTAYKKGEAVLTGKTQDFLDAVKNQIDENALIEKLENEITEKSKAAVAKLYPAGSEEYNKALNKMLEEKIPAAIDELRNKTIPQFIKEVSAALQKLDKLENDTLVIVNGEKPVEVGEYQIYGYNYDVAKASGTLYIVDAYEIAITVEPDSYTMDSGEATPVVEITVKKNGELPLTFLVPSGNTL